MIDWTKPIETTDGREAKVLTTEYHYQHSVSTKTAVTALLLIRNLIGSNKEAVSDNLVVYQLSTGKPYWDFEPEIRNKITRVKAWIFMPNNGDYMNISREESEAKQLQKTARFDSNENSTIQEVTIEFVGDAPKGF